MKKWTSFVGGAALMLSSALSAAQSELVLKMEMNKVKGESLDGWINNQAVNKVDKVQLFKDADGSVFLRTKNFVHYYYPKLYSVNETDTIVVTIKARGTGMIEPGYYLFDRLGGFHGPIGKKFPLCKDWKEFRFEAPVVNRTLKGKQCYSSRVRPLIQTTGNNLEFKDYTISVVRNPILKEWIVDMKESTGTVVPGVKEIVLTGKMEYVAPKILSAKIGDTVSVQLKVRGKGKVDAGAFLYDLKYNPNRKGDGPCGNVHQSQEINSVDWKDVSLRVKISNVEKDGKKFFVNRIKPFFRMECANEGKLEIQKAEWKITGEKISVPEF